ncbi:hypothetical protein J2Y63_002416 [Shinella sp. BE166]
MTTRSWWDEVPYTENEQQPFSMQIETGLNLTASAALSD